MNTSNQTMVQITATRWNGERLQDRYLGVDYVPTMEDAIAAHEIYEANVPDGTIVETKVVYIQ